MLSVINIIGEVAKFHWDFMASYARTLMNGEVKSWSVQVQDRKKNLPRVMNRIQMAIVQHDLSVLE